MKRYMIGLVMGLVSTIKGEDALRDLAKSTGISVGTALNYKYLLENPDYGEMAAKEYDLITAENMCKMNFIAKSFTENDFTGCQQLLDFAKKNDMKFRGHVLIWAAPGTHNPSFVSNEKNLTKLEEYMKTYIHDVVSEFGNDIFAWDVVNEAITDNKKANNSIKESPWSSIPDFICKAFQAAHDANPKIELFYNDYKHAPASGDYKIKSDRVFRMIRKLTRHGCPIHGVGFQNHIDISFSDEDIEGIRANVQRYAQLGLKIHFSETDVRCNQFGDKTCNLTNPWPQEQLDRQAEIYSQILQICLDEPLCVNFESWGFTDRKTFLPDGQNAFIFDKNMNPKPAYTKMIETLKNATKSPIQFLQ